MLAPLGFLGLGSLGTTGKLAFVTFSSAQSLRIHSLLTTSHIVEPCGSGVLTYSVDYLIVDSKFSAQVTLLYTSMDSGSNAIRCNRSVRTHYIAK